jgi:hypothetical protein
VSVKFEGFSRKVVGWYWSGLDRNTCHAPLPTKEEAKAEADAYYKSWKREQAKAKA